MFSIPLSGTLDQNIQYRDNRESVKTETIRNVLLDVFEEENDPDQLMCNYLDGKFKQPDAVILKSSFWKSGFCCQIIFRDGYYTGQILVNQSNLNQTERKLLSDLDDLDSDDKIYNPHGGLTTDFGFDCLHSGDLWLSRHGLIDMPSSNQVATFKTKKYVENELNIYAESLRNFLINDATKKFYSKSF